MPNSTSSSTGKSKPKKPAPPRPRSYTPLSDALNQPFTFADTELGQGIKNHSLIGLLRGAMKRKRRSDGEPLPNLFWALLVWPLLHVKSIHCFCSELCQILKGKASVLYDFLGREDVNWRAVSHQLARQVDQSSDMGSISSRAFVVDDTSKARSGRKVQGTSSYFDHTEGRIRKGHQVLQLGMAAEKGFLPLASQIVMGEKCAIGKPEDKPFRDERSSAARDFRRAGEQSKNQLFRDMLQRARQAGFRARYLLADAWFGCRENIRCGVDQSLAVIFQMKRGNMKYQWRGGSYTATELYNKVQRRMKPKNAKARYKTASLVVSINLEADERQPAHWVEVRLVFSAPARCASTNTWVVFLCTDLELTDHKILEVYSLRWSIEVYFKEIKQSLGFLKEQSGRYEVAYASIHLAAIRYLLLFEAMLKSGGMSFGEIRDRESGRIQALTYATLLWQLFRAIIEGALETLVKDLGGKVVKKVMAAINQSVEDFLNNALQMAPDQVAVQLDAEKCGYL